jgi:CubicO group peptidase (beta-lactamase class C family)
LQQLITHCSGLGYGFGQPAGNAYEAAGVSDGLDASGLSLAENMHRLAKLPLFEAPGAAWRYSLGIDLLGLVLEEAAGQTLPQIIAQQVTGPLGMRDTGFFAPMGAILATPYADGTPPRRMMAQDAVPMGPALIRFAPDRAYDARAFPSGGTGLIGTAADYLRFLEAMRTGGAGVVSPQMAQRFVTNAVGDKVVGMPGSGLGWGLGVAIWRDPAATRSPLNPGSWSWGGVYGHSFWVDPVAELSVVGLTNTAIAGMAGAFLEAVKQAVYAGLA